MLGGALEQYRKMYEKCIEVFKKHIFYRPMLPDGIDVLLSGNANVDGASGQVNLDPEVQHLACFTGGMVDIAAKIFDRPQDSDTARRLVDGCIWAYGSTVTGIMPESFRVVSCENSADCDWEESKWNAAKDLGQNVPPGITKYGDKRYILR